MVGRVRRGVAAALLGLLLAGCATFPDDGPREWRERVEGAGELGGPPTIPDPAVPEPPAPDAEGQVGELPPSLCVDPDPQVVATCLEPVGEVAVLPDILFALCV